MRNASAQPGGRVRRTLRRVALIALPVFVLASIVGWVLTHGRAAGIDYRFGSYLEPGSRGGDATMWTYRSKSLMVTSTNGLIAFSFSGYSSFADSREGLHSWKDTSGWRALVIDGVSSRPRDWWRWRGVSNFSFLGLGYMQGSSRGEDVWSVTIPCWLLAFGSTSVWIVLWLPVRRRRRRLASGRCIACGYSRAGLAETDPCPECGPSAPPRP